MNRLSQSLMMVFVLAGMAVEILPAQVVVVARSGPTDAGPPQSAVVGHSVRSSSSSSTLTLELADGTDVRLGFARGNITLNDDVIGRYDPQGPVGAAWGAFLDQVSQLSTPEVLQALSSLTLPGDVTPAVDQLRAATRELQVAEAPGAVAAGRGVSIPNIDVVIPSIEIPSIPVESTPRIAATRSPSIVGSVMSNVLSLAASLVGLTFMGFGFLVFAPRQFSQVADTGWHSFGRSFLTGLFAQPLLVPALGALIVGLALTVVGILVIPFAILAFMAALVVSITGGYIAIARSIGEIYVRRRGHVDPLQPGWMELKYVLVGLTGLLAIWVPAAFLSWVPGIGMLFILLAAILTWVVATAGLGASILSRGGIRGTIVRRLDYALTDQRLWDTSPAITTTGWRARDGT